MLSIKNISDATAATSYYEKDNYYTKGSDESFIGSCWFGKGAKRLGLNNQVDLSVFEALLEGHLPNGQMLGWTKAQYKKYESLRRENPTLPKRSAHRPGFDLTFSMPKSATLLIELGSDKRLIDADKRAIAEALTYIESYGAQTRRMIDGKVQFEKTNSLIVAQFRHNLARQASHSKYGPDPDDHTHCVVINATERGDGKFGSLSNEELYKLKMTSGMVYRARLIQELQQCGYTVEQKHADGRVEIVGISEDVLRHFSQRRLEIEKELSKKGQVGAKAASHAALSTRNRKERVDRSTLFSEWETRARALDFNPSLLVEAAKARTKHEEIIIDYANLSDKSVQYAIRHLEERESVLYHKDIVRNALQYSFGKTTLNDITCAIARVEKRGELIALKNDRFTTPLSLKLERENIDFVKAGKDQLPSLVDKKTLDKHFNNHTYTRGQQKAIAHILGTRDRIIGVQGYAGTGKTTTLRGIRTVLHAVNALKSTEGYSIIGLAPTKNAAGQLELKAGIEAKTLARYLIDIKQLGLSDRKASMERPLLVILDEASMVSSRQMHALLKAVTNQKIRLVMIGDKKQLSAVDAGKPFEQLQCNGLKTVVMDEILRQKTHTLKKAVEKSLTGDIKAAFKNISGGVREISHKGKRLEKVAEEYLSYSESARKRTMVLVPANEDRRVVNNLIRAGLKREGVLPDKEIETSILINKPLSGAERERAQHYDVNDIVRFNKTYKRLDIKSGDYFSVLKTDAKTNEVVLKNETTDKEIHWYPDKVAGKRSGVVEVYQQEDRKLSKNDSIRWLKNFHDGRVNGQTATVLRVEAGKALIRLKNDKTLLLGVNDNKGKHWDYAFAHTVYSKQGSSNVHVIAHMESFRACLSTQRSFYVTLSRAELGATLIVDNKDALITALEHNTGDKLSALQALSDMHSSKKVTNYSTDWHKTATKEPHQAQHTQKEQQEQKEQKEQKTPKNVWDVERLKETLNNQAEDVARAVIKDREFNTQKSTDTTLVWGRKHGSLHVALQGRKAGNWYDFEAGEGGDMLKLISVQTGLDFKGSLDYAGALTGLSQTTRQAVVPKKACCHTTDKPHTPTTDDVKAIAKAQTIASMTKAIQGTIAEKYLRDFRGIKGDLPDSLRYLPRFRVWNNEAKRHEYYPALVAIAKAKTGEIQAVQLTFLDHKTHNKADIDIKKRTFGRIKFGASVELNPHAKDTSKLFLTEGIENGLSIKDALLDHPN